MPSPSKAWGVFRAHIRRWRARFSWPAFLLILIALAGIVLSTAIPAVLASKLSWRTWAAWKAAIGQTFVVMIFSIYLRYEEKIRKWVSTRGPRHEWQVRMADLARIMDQFSPPDRRKTAEINRLREDILRCVVSGVAEVLDLPASSLCANLLDFPAHDLKKMVVTARSSNVRVLGVEYDCVDAFIPWRAVKAGSMEVEDNYREREGLGPRRYKSVVAIPVTRGKVARGCLSIDCTIPYAFTGRKLQIYYQVRPYIASLALTYVDSDPYYECSFNPAHL